MTRRRLFYLLGLAFVLTAIQMRVILAFANPTLEEMHETVVGLTAPSPYRYRILVPFLMELVQKTGLNLIAVYAGFYFVANSLSLAAIYSWFQLHVTAKAALFGSVLATVSMIWAYSDGTVHPWTNLEVVFVAALMWLAWRDSNAVVPILVMSLAVLNRETGLALPLVYFILAGKRRWQSALIGLVAGGLIYGLLLWLVGDGPRIITLDEIISYNVSLVGLFYAVLGLVGFLGGFWLDMRNWPKGRVGSRLFAILILYLFPIVVFGIWREVRLLVPLIPVLFIPVVKHFDERM